MNDKIETPEKKSIDRNIIWILVLTAVLVVGVLVYQHQKKENTISISIGDKQISTTIE